MQFDVADGMDMDRLKEVKVKIPVRFHIQLLSMKVLTGKQISDAVSEALEDYFVKIGALPEAHGGPSGPPPEGPAVDRL